MAASAVPAWMAARLHADFVDLAMDNKLVTPGALTVLGTDVDLTLLNKITAVTGGAAVRFSDMGQMTAAILGSTETQ